ncbi:mediator of RNA polymerase II transcription subunit 21 [Medicago truncatula]|uniref:Mediator of RNA polymerase II transcription subunit 21 n=1 Tax=Medicago truncatula TaxID=3880 RepID=A0A072VRR0_MEDTR|nr:mediator of RNA polymerase II transcription subunit 21 [Medicago truncatula]
MDIVSQLQEQVNLIAHLASNTVGTLQRDAPSSQLSPNYPEPPAHTTSMDSANFSEQPKLMASTLMKAAKQAPFPVGDENRSPTVGDIKKW